MRVALPWTNSANLTDVALVADSGSGPTLMAMHEVVHEVWGSRYVQLRRIHVFTAVYCRFCSVDEPPDNGFLLSYFPSTEARSHRSCVRDLTAILQRATR